MYSAKIRLPSLYECNSSLLKEAKPLNVEAGPKEVSESPKPSININLPTDNISVEERQLLGRYGVWLLVGLCTPTQNTPVDILGRLISMLFHWFHVTAYSYDGKYYMYKSVRIMVICVSTVTHTRQSTALQL